MNTLLKTIATPLTIFASFAIFGSGLWMFFFSKPHALTEFHERIGIVFVIAAALHVALHWKSYTNRLGKKSTYMYIAPVLLFGVVALVEGFDTTKKPTSLGAIVKKLEKASLHSLATTFGAEESEIKAHMEKDGLMVSSFDVSLSAAAEANKKEARKLLEYFVQ